jgi:hypothetical protein
LDDDAVEMECCASSLGTGESSVAVGLVGTGDLCPRDIEITAVLASITSSLSFLRAKLLIQSEVESGNTVTVLFLGRHAK